MEVVPVDVAVLDGVLVVDIICEAVAVREAL